MEMISEKIAFSPTMARFAQGMQNVILHIYFIICIDDLFDFRIFYLLNLLPSARLELS